MINTFQGQVRLESATLRPFLRSFQIAGVTIFPGLALLDQRAKSP
jgi:hypothetical protein